MGGLLCRKCRRSRTRVVPTNGPRTAWNEAESDVCSTTEEREGFNKDQKTAPSLPATKVLPPGQPPDTLPDSTGESSGSESIEGNRRTVETEVAAKSQASRPATGNSTPSKPLGSRPVSRNEGSRPTSVLAEESVTKRVSTTSGAPDHSRNEASTTARPEPAGGGQTKSPLSPQTNIPLLPGQPPDATPDSRRGSSGSSAIERGHQTVEVDIAAESGPNSDLPAQSDNHTKPTVIMVLPWTDDRLPGQPLVGKPISGKASSTPTSVQSLENEAMTKASDHPLNDTESITGPTVIERDRNDASSSPVTEAPLLSGQSSTSTSSVVESLSHGNESLSSSSLTPANKASSIPGTKYVGGTNLNQQSKSILSRLMPKTSEMPAREKVAKLLSSWDASGKLGLLESSAESVPQDSTHSVSDLAIALKGDNSHSPTSTESQIALSYKIYCWVAKNVMYVKGSRNADPNDVLKTRRAVCHGYTTLFQALAEEAGLTVRRVSGNTREWLSSPGTRFIPDTSNQHTWNIIKIDAVWFPVDCTYGSGSTINGRFVRKFKKLYFLPAPEQLIMTHWVEDELLQLLEYPATLTDLQQLIVPNLETLSLGIVPTTEMQFITLPPNTCIAEVHTSCKSNILLTATLNSIGNGQTVELAKNMTFVKKCGEEVVVSAIIPTAGSFLLKIFYTRRSNLEERGVQCLSYIITSETTLEEPEYVGFPRVYFHTAARCGFSIATWRGSNNQPKHIMKANGTLEIEIELESNAKLDHYIRRGKISDANSARRKCLTKLSPSRNPTFHNLKVILPSEGWWTIIISDIEQKLIVMEYEIYSIRGIKNAIYPSTTGSANDLGVVLHDNYTPTAYSDSLPLTITFTAPPGLSYDVELNQIDESGNKLGKSAPDYCTYVSPRQQDSQHRVHVILPPGTWSLDLYAGEPNSTTLKCVISSEPLSGPDVQPELAYPIVHRGLLDMRISFLEDMLPYTSTCNTGLFQFPFDAPHDICYSLSLKEDIEVTSEQDDYAVVSKPKGSISRINAIVPHPGNWTLTVYAQRSRLLEEGSNLPCVFKLHFEAAVCPEDNKTFPHITSTFMRMSFLPPYNIEEWLLPRTVKGAGYPKHIDIPFLQLSEEVELFREIEHNKQKYTGDVARLKVDTRNGDIIRTLSIAIPEEGEWVFKLNARYLRERKSVVSQVLSYTVSVIECDS